MSTGEIPYPSPEEVRLLVAAPVAATELSYQFPDVPLEAGVRRLLLATDAQLRQELGETPGPQEAEVATGGLQRLTRFRRRQAEPEVPPVSVQLCDPYTADLTYVLWDMQSRTRPNRVAVTDMSLATYDLRHRFFGKQVIRIDQGLDPDRKLIRPSVISVETDRGSGLKPVSVVQGAAMVEAGAVIDRSRPVPSELVKEIFKQRDYLALRSQPMGAEQVLGIVASHMGSDWAARS